MNETQPYMSTNMKRFLVVFFFLSIASVCLISVTACSQTITPTPVVAQVASFDGEVQNSGIIGLWDGKSFKAGNDTYLPKPDWLPADAPTGYYVTAHFRDRFNALVKIYGYVFQPKLKKDEGLTPVNGQWCITRQSLVRMVQMNTWHKTDNKK